MFLFEVFLMEVFFLDVFVEKSTIKCLHYKLFFNTISNFSDF